MAEVKSAKGNNESVQKRLKKGFITILVFLVACIIISAIALVKVGTDYQYAIENYGFAQGYAGQLGIEFNTMTTDLRNVILETDEASIDTLKTTLVEEAEAIDKYLAQVRDIANSEEEYVLIDEMESVIGKFRDVKAQVMELAEDNKNDEAYELLKTEAVQYAVIIKANINTILELNIEKCQVTMNSANSLTIILLCVIIALGLLAVAIGMKLSTSISKSICDPIEELMGAADKLKEGELDITIRHQSGDELGKLADSFREACTFMKEAINDTSEMLEKVSQGNFVITSSNTSVYKGQFQNILESMRKLKDRMNNALLNIRDASGQVNAGAGQMAESAQNLAEGATDQAGAVQELMATIENVSAMVSESAEGAESAYRQALDCEQEAGRSSQSMSELTTAMEKINEVAQQIGNIIAEIEDIASQTNLLSLNASIEAARAGEAGRGFAVVADQIGKLASDSAKSAANTRDLIENAISEIGHGNEVTKRTSDALDKVVDGIKQLGENAKEVTANSQTQAESMKQIEAGIEQISSVVQNNSAAAEETSATSEELSAQATNLNAEVSKFQLNER